MDDLKVEGPDGYDFAMDPGWDDQVVYALGVAYQLSDKLALRAGFNYAASPIDEDNAARMMTLHRDNGRWRKPEPVEDSP